jgi:hypothetical protein
MRLCANGNTVPTVELSNRKHCFRVRNRSFLVSRYSRFFREKESYSQRSKRSSTSRVRSLDRVGPLVILPALGALEQFR